MTAQERITEWAELADKATEGPWFVESDEDEGTRVSFLHQRNGLVLLGSVASEWQELFLEDAAHIAASRTAVPAMAAALTAVLKFATEERDKISTTYVTDPTSAYAGYANAMDDVIRLIETALEASL